MAIHFLCFFLSLFYFCVVYYSFLFECLPQHTLRLVVGSNDLNMYTSRSERPRGGVSKGIDPRRSPIHGIDSTQIWLRPSTTSTHTQHGTPSDRNKSTIKGTSLRSCPRGTDSIETHRNSRKVSTNRSRERQETKNGNEIMDLETNCRKEVELKAK